MTKLNEKKYIAICNAMGRLYKLNRKWRIGLQYKEKWGTLRVQGWFNNGNLHDLIWPGHYGIRWRRILDRNWFYKLMWKLDWYVFPKLLKPFWYIFTKLQIRAFNKCIDGICRDYPVIAEDVRKEVKWSIE